MGSKNKVNHVNFSYLFSVSILSLFAIFLTMMVPNAKDLLTGKKTPQQFDISGQVYQLIPHPGPNIAIVVRNPDSPLTSGQIVDMELQDQTGHTVLNQSNYHYEWSVADHSIVQLAMQAWEAGASCPFGITPPCPAIRGEIIGLKAGSTTITVKAIYTEQRTDPASGVITEIPTEVASTMITVKVTPQIPEQALVNYKFRFKGVNKVPTNSIIERMTVNLVNPENPTGSFGSYTNSSHSVASNNDATYVGYFYLDRGYFGRSNYRLCIKGLKHLQKCFDNIYISYDDNQFLDFSGVSLEPGDLSLPQNSWVDNNDLSYLWDHRGSRDGSILAIADLNYDGVINMGDINLLLPNLGKTDDRL